MSDTPRLVRPTPELAAALVDMARECREAGEERYLSAERDYAAWLSRRDELARAGTLAPNRVPCLWFFLLQQGRVLGGSRLRLELNDELRKEGGHVGYDIRPSERGRGHGTLILALTLVEAARRRMQRVLVTTNEDNLPSRRIIERNGGRLQGQGLSDESGKLVLRYWIELPAEDGIGPAGQAKP